MTPERAKWHRIYNNLDRLWFAAINSFEYRIIELEQQMMLKIESTE